MNDVRHPTCEKTWTNNDTVGHCSACCETFYGLKAFDKHRRRQRCSTTDPQFWQDEKKRWHYGPRMTLADRERVAKRETA